MYEEKNDEDISTGGRALTWMKDFLCFWVTRAKAGVELEMVDVVEESRSHREENVLKVWRKVKPIRFRNSRRTEKIMKWKWSELKMLTQRRKWKWKQKWEEEDWKIVMVVIINGHENHDMTKRMEIMMIGIISDIDSVYVHQEVSPMATVLVQNWCA